MTYLPSPSLLYTNTLYISLSAFKFVTYLPPPPQLTLYKDLLYHCFTWWLINHSSVSYITTVYPRSLWSCLSLSTKLTIWKQATTCLSWFKCVCSGDYRRATSMVSVFEHVTVPGCDLVNNDSFINHYGLLFYYLHEIIFILRIPYYTIFLREGRGDHPKTLTELLSHT